MHYIRTIVTHILRSAGLRLDHVRGTLSLGREFAVGTVDVEPVFRPCDRDSDVLRIGHLDGDRYAMYPIPGPALITVVLAAPIDCEADTGTWLGS